MIRVTAVIEGLGFGGAERLLVDTAQGLDHRRFALQVVTLFDSQRAYAGPLAALGVPERTLALSGPRAILKGVLPLARLLEQSGADVVHTHLFCANVVGRLAARITGRPVVSSLHDADYEPVTRAGNPGLGPLRHELLRIVDRLTLETCSARVVAVSQYVADSARARLNLRGDRLRVIPNGVDLERFRPAEDEPGPGRLARGFPPDAVLLLCVGRLTQQKGQDVLLQALARAELRELPLHLLLVGEGGARAQYESSTIALGLQDRVQFLGARQDVPDLMRLADLLVLPSRHEGFGLVLPEAMATGLPVVASRIPPVMEIVKEGGTGLLFDPEDPQDLARALRSLVVDATLRRELGRAALEDARARFGLGEMTKALEDLYLELASARA